VSRSGLEGSVSSVDTTFVEAMPATTVLDPYTRLLASGDFVGDFISRASSTSLCLFLSLSLIILTIISCTIRTNTHMHTYHVICT
jgi:hypothetical protein